MKTFVLGVGAQKAGTSWLHDYLSGLPGFAPGFEKEYHILDARYLEEGRRYERRTWAKGLRAIPAIALKRLAAAAGVQVDDQHNRIDLARLSLMRSEAAYFDYFANLLAAPQVTHTADFTPEYAALTTETLREVRSEFLDRGIHVKAVFVMRDPVERAWSASRMFVRQRKGGIFAGHAGEWPDERSAVASLCKSDHFLALGRYETTINRLEKAFGQDDVWLGFYERLFDNSTVLDIARFLGLPFEEPDLSRRVNAAPKAQPIDPEIAAMLRDCFEDTYRFLDDRFPGWSAAREELVS